MNSNSNVYQFPGAHKEPDPPPDEPVHDGGDSGGPIVIKVTLVLEDAPSAEPPKEDSGKGRVAAFGCGALAGLLLGG